MLTRVGYLFMGTGPPLTENDIIISYITNYNTSKIRWGMFSIYVSLLLLTISVHSNLYIIIQITLHVTKFTTYKITNDHRASLLVYKPKQKSSSVSNYDTNNISLAFKAEAVYDTPLEL